METAAPLIPPKLGKRPHHSARLHGRNREAPRQIAPARPGLSLSRQCCLLSISRSAFYYAPRGESPENLAVMRRIDELHLASPFAGARMLRDLLRREGHKIGRKRVRTMMARRGIEALYRNPHTSQRHPAHRVYPYLLRHLAITRSNQVGGGGYHVHSDAGRFHVSDGNY